MLLKIKDKDAYAYVVPGDSHFPVLFTESIERATVFRVQNGHLIGTVDGLDYVGVVSETVVCFLRSDLLFNSVSEVVLGPSVNLKIVESSGSFVCTVSESETTDVELVHN
jgi:hypothetical protein